MKNKIVSLFGRKPLCEWPKNYTRADIQKEVNRLLAVKGLTVGTGVGHPGSFSLGLYRGEPNKDSNLICIISFIFDKVGEENVLGFNSVMFEQYQDLGVEHLLCAWAATNPQWNHLFNYLPILFDDTYGSREVRIIYDSGMFNVFQLKVGDQFRATIKAGRTGDLSVEETFKLYVEGKPAWQQSRSYEEREYHL
jgi:hypothetical protein